MLRKRFIIIIIIIIITIKYEAGAYLPMRSTLFNGEYYRPC